jgi:hypothetical protein
VMRNHVAAGSDVAVHAQPAGAVTPTAPPPPPAPMLADVDDSAKEQPTPWLTLNVCPAIVSVADRAAPAFGSAVNSTRPLPLPLDPAVMRTHDAAGSAVAVQPHPEAAVTSTAPEPPAGGMFAELALNANEQPAAWLRVNVRPATVIVPLRAGPACPETLNRTDPGPLPDVGGVNVIHGAWLVAFQAQPPAVVTRTSPEPPPTGRAALDGSIEYAHPCDCVAVNVCPATVREPVRVGPSVAATSNATAPLPLLLAPDVIVIHPAWLVAVHGQPSPVETVTVPDPPLAPTFWLGGAMV